MQILSLLVPCQLTFSQKNSKLSLPCIRIVFHFLSFDASLYLVLFRMWWVSLAFFMRLFYIAKLLSTPLLVASIRMALTVLLVAEFGGTGLSRL